MHFLIPAALGGCFLAFLVWLQVEAARERKRRRLLPQDARRALEQDDAVWSQTFTF
jgi:hypothetical protein